MTTLRQLDLPTYINGTEPAYEPRPDFETVYKRHPITNWHPTTDGSAWIGTVTASCSLPGDPGSHERTVDAIELENRLSVNNHGAFVISVSNVGVITVHVPSR